MAAEAEEKEEQDDWVSTVPADILSSLPQSEINRQSIIYKLIAREKQYLRDLDTVESVCSPLVSSSFPI